MQLLGRAKFLTEDENPKGKMKLLKGGEFPKGGQISWTPGNFFSVWICLNKNLSIMQIVHLFCELTYPIFSGHETAHRATGHFSFSLVACGIVKQL